MTIKFEKITPGMELLDIHSYRMGNTTMTRLGLSSSWHYLQSKACRFEASSKPCGWSSASRKLTRCDRQTSSFGLDHP